MIKKIKVYLYIFLSALFYLWNLYADRRDKKIFKEIYKDKIDTNV